jgi:hypothetical protein
MAKEEGVEPQIKAQAHGSSGSGHEEGILKKLWHTFTDLNSK